MNFKSTKYGFFIVSAMFILFLFTSLQYFHWIVDDLFIYFRYAENFIKGQGIVFNPGERVEGFSGFTWFLLLSLFKFSGLPLEISAKITGLVMTFFILMYVYKISLTLLNQQLSYLVCILMLFNLPFMLWSESGFEIMLYLLLQVVIFYKIINQDKIKSSALLFAALLFLLSISRPEGILFSICYLFFINLFSSDKNYTVRISVLFLLMIFAFLSFRFLYFGEILPNTYYAKIGHSFAGYYEFRSYRNGIYYIKDFFLHNIQFVTVVLLLLFTYKSLKSNNVFKIVVMVIMLQFFFIVFSGGDWMVQYRFMVPSIPFLSLLTVICFNELIKKYKLNYKIIFSSVILILIMISYSFISEDKSVINKETVMWNKLKELSPEIKKIIPAQSLVANGSSGIIPYYLDQVVFLDLVGLTDKYIARNGLRRGSWFERSLPEYVYEKNPGWIIMWKKKNNNGEFTFNDASPCYYDMSVNDNFGKYDFVKEFELYEDVKIELYKKNN